MNCPTCGEPINALVTRGPSEHFIELWGCRASAATALNLAGKPKAMTDGGHSTEEVEQFWSQYSIPFEYGSAIKVRRSGLLRESSGAGRARDTVEHLHVKEAFRDGRLSRSADSYLCEPNSYVTQQAQELPVSNGLPKPITCETCLKRMERWHCDDQPDVNAEDGDAR